MSTPSISVIILTFNEEQHIERCLRSLQGIADTIFVVDSFSTDNTCALATALGAKVYQNKWVNYSTQFNWGLANCPIATDWTMRMDCDEYLLPELITEIQHKIPVAAATTGGFIHQAPGVLHGPLDSARRLLPAPAAAHLAHRPGRH